VSRSLRIAFFGTPQFAVPTLTRLLESSHAVVAVVTQPDRPRGRGQRVSDVPVKATAIARAIPVLQPDRLGREQFESQFRDLAVDLGVVAAYGKLLPEWLLHAPPRGMINVHASLLPRWRGAAPIQRAVLAGDTETGVTIMRIVRALDAGPMLASVRHPIGFEDGSDQVEQALAVLGADLLLRIVEQLADGPVVETPQLDSEAIYAPRMTKEEGLIDWSRPMLDLHNHVRGMRPWPNAFTFLDGTRLVLHRAHPGERISHEPPGSIVSVTNGITIACGDRRTLEVLQVQAEGRRAVLASEFGAGQRGLLGRRLG
jgi:methionyl-tRNA formyltransferase